MEIMSRKALYEGFNDFRNQDERENASSYQQKVLPSALRAVLPLEQYFWYQQDFEDALTEAWEKNGETYQKDDDWHYLQLLLLHAGREGRQAGLRIAALDLRDAGVDLAEIVFLTELHPITIESLDRETAVRYEKPEMPCITEDKYTDRTFEEMIKFQLQLYRRFCYELEMRVVAARKEMTDKLKAAGHLAG